MSFRRRISGLNAEQIKMIPKEELELPPTMEDFFNAIKKVNKSVSNDDLEKYKKWMEEFGSVWSHDQSRDGFCDCAILWFLCVLSQICLSASGIDILLYKLTPYGHNNYLYEIYIWSISFVCANLWW